LVRRLELLAEAPWRRGEVDRAAAELQAIVDVYLDEVLRPRQQIAKFSRLFEFLERTSPDDLLHFTDATLLGFWREAAERPEDYADFKLFRTAFLFFCDVHSAMLEGESMLARDASLRLGPNREAGEIDVGDAAAAEPGECWRSPLEHFAQAPLGDSKILNETERRQLQLLLAAGPVALTHVRSLLRAEVMGGVQEKLAKGRLPRDTDGAARLARLVTLAVLDEPGETDEPARNYIVQAQRYANLAEHVRRVLKIAGLVRWRARAEDDNPIMIAELETGLRAAERLLLRVSRAGFKEALTTPKAAAPFLAALDPLLAVDRLLTGLGNALTRLGADGGLDAALAADRPPFAEAFQLLYGKPT